MTTKSIRSQQYDSAHDATSVTPHDTNALTDGICKALYVGVSGDVSVIMAQGTTVTFKNVPVGVFPLRVTHVRSTATTATEIIALY